MKNVFLFLTLFLSTIFCLQSQETEILYLTGQGKDDPVEWDFYCKDGRKSGTWTKIGLPSCWELKGFGTYNYGHDPSNKEEE
jgi:hypothetical protein